MLAPQRRVAACLHRLLALAVLGLWSGRGGSAGEVTEEEPLAVSCPEGFGDLRDPEFFDKFGRWQNRYGRDNLGLSAQFLGTYSNHVAPVLDEALKACPAYVLEVMMNAVLKIESDEGLAAARSWILQIYSMRDLAFKTSTVENRRKLEILMREWDVDIAAVYPKLLDIQRLGPNVALGGDHDDSSTTEQHQQDVCLGQRFYVYELDRSFYEPSTFRCLQGQWGTEVVMHHFFRHNCRTANAEVADWFYVPLYGTCKYVALNSNLSDQDGDLTSMDELSNKYIWEPLLDFLRRSKFYQRKEGKDHIFLFADGQGPRIWDSYDALRSESIFLSPESKCPTWGEPVRRLMDVKPCLSSWKDIVIPGHTDYARIEYMRKQNKPSEERRLLMTFHGRTPGLHKGYSDCAVRDAIMGLGRHGPHVDVGGFVEDYPERKGDSHFCLVPAGTSPWTNHLYESFYAGCIPVILSDEYEVAFADELDWPSFSIKWPEAEVGQALYEHLESFTVYFPQRLIAMKASLEQNACWLNWYSTDTTCSPYLLIMRRLKGLLAVRRSPPRFWTVDVEALGSEPSEPPLVFAHLRRPTRFKHLEGEASNFSYLTPVTAAGATAL